MKTIFVPISCTFKTANALKLARYLAVKSRANVELFPLDSTGVDRYYVNEGETATHYNQTPQQNNIYNYAQAERAKQSNQTADLIEVGLPEADLIVMDSALVGGRYEMIANSEAEGTKAVNTSGELFMDDDTEGTKGACAAHELPLHPAVEALMKQAHSPVLTVVSHKFEIVPLKTVVFVTDGEEGSTPLCNVLAQLQRIFKFKLHLLHINRYFHHQHIIAVVNNMREMAKAHSFTHYQIHVVEDDTYEEGIIHFYDKLHPDMIALPVDGHKIISHLLEEIFSHAKNVHAVPYLLTYKLN